MSVDVSSTHIEEPKQLELFDPFTDLGDMVMGKVTSSSEKPGFFPKGGSGKMYGKGSAGKVTPGQSGKESNSPAGGGEKFASGGSGKMFGKQSANKMTPGQSGKAG
jgi:hypothetical protein